MPARRELLILGGTGLAAALAGAIFGPLALQSESGAAELLAARYPDTSGTPRQILEWRGKVLVCNFWATWCLPCREEIPLLMQVRARYAANGAEVVGIGIDLATKIQQFAREFAISYPLLVADASGLDLMRKLGNRAGGLPYTVIIDRNGAIAYRRLGLLRAAELTTNLDKMVR
jgi:thiol-disulfide isomerase/thioredoxin